MGRQFIRKTWMALAAVGIVFAAIAALLQSSRQPEMQPRPVIASIVRIGPQPDAYHAMTYVLARSAEGYQRSRFVAVQNLKCRVGDRVDGQVRGRTLSFNERTCRRPPLASR
jgi:hypothetical protein